MSADPAGEIFEAMVESVGIKAYAGAIGLSTRQIHRMLNGSQPNPIQRFVEALRACEGMTAQGAVDYACRQAGGYFVQRADDLAKANVNAVKESAEAIVAISEDRAPRVEIKEIREAISALAALERLLVEKEKATAKA
jgi:hypothetical protein